MILQIFFWTCLLIIIYTYVGYGILLGMMVTVKRKFWQHPTKCTLQETDLPEVTILIAAYNEEDYVKEKIENTTQLDYPAHKLKVFFVTDGSTDQTPNIIKDYITENGGNIQLFHQAGRKGKIAAIERVMPFVSSPIVIFSDANTIVNSAAVKNLVRHYQIPEVAAVAGEKRIHVEATDDASSSGEGFYWKYESILKDGMVNYILW